MDIIYKGIKTVNKVPFICFTAPHGQLVEIPVDTLTADRFTRYMDKISVPVVAGHVEPDEPDDISDM